MSSKANQSPVTVTGLIEASAAVAPQTPALIYGGQTLTFAGLAGQARRAAGGLASLGVKPGDRVAFWLPNTPAYVTLYLACARLGAIAVAVNTRYRAGEVGDIIGRSGAKVLVLWPDFRGIDFPGILDDVDPEALKRLETVIVYTESDEIPSVTVPGARTVAWERVARHSRFDADHSAADNGCNIFTTSGTTRAPKFVLHGHAGITGHALEVAAHFGLNEPGTVTYLGLPFCGVFGFCQVMAALAAAKPTVLTSAFDAAESVRLLEGHGVTYFNGSDDMIDRMLAVMGNRKPFRQVRAAGYAVFNSELGDIVSRADAAGLKLTGLWGMSELQALAARRDPDASIEVRATPGGQLISPTGEARVRDPDSGALRGNGEAGELEIKAPSRMLEYYGDADATVAAVTEDGFIRTGDLGLIEPDGGFEFLSRMGDVLRLGGFLVSPAEIEAEVQSHPMVESVQVVAAGSTAGNRAVAFVIPGAETVFEEAAIQTHCTQRLAKYKVPARVVSIDAFPVTESANGVKIQRAKLREMAEDLLRE
jgi:fatty-acyl-CoA synthase